MKLSLVVALVPMFAVAGIKYWDNPEYNSYSYVEGSSPACVRLTWGPLPDGMMLLVR